MAQRESEKSRYPWLVYSAYCTSRWWAVLFIIVTGYRADGAEAKGRCYDGDRLRVSPNSTSILIIVDSYHKLTL